MPSCAFGDCAKFIAGGRTDEACHLCFLAHQPLGWQPEDVQHWQARAMEKLRRSLPQQPTSPTNPRKRRRR